MMTIEEAARIMNGETKGENAVINDVSVDTRNLDAGAMYFAIKGDRFNGHDFIQQAMDEGASVAVVDHFSEMNIAQIKVEDTRKALGRLAAGWRQKFGGTVVGVTGSNGKTTVKEMIAAIFAMQGEVMATRGNFNNDIGLPLTLLRMEEKQDYAVIEMGANHKGEIAELTQITRPDIAVITNAGSAHLEGFGSRRGIAEAKGEIFSGLGENGIAVINADDDFCEYWSDICKHKKISYFALDNKMADVKGDWQASSKGGKLKVSTGGAEIEIDLKVAGRHNAMNALAAIAVSRAAGISMENIKQAMVDFGSVKGRLEFVVLRSGATIINDTYNANPESLVAGLEVLTGLGGEHWLVLGDMGELGEQAELIHREMGIKARQAGVSCLFAIGRNAAASVEGFGSNGRHFSDQEALIDSLMNALSSDLNILVKGSRFMQMEKVVDALTRGDKPCC